MTRIKRTSRFELEVPNFWKSAKRYLNIENSCQGGKYVNMARGTFEHKKGCFLFAVGS